MDATAKEALEEGLTSAGWNPCRASVASEPMLDQRPARWGDVGIVVVRNPNPLIPCSRTGPWGAKWRRPEGRSPTSRGSSALHQHHGRRGGHQPYTEG